MSNIEKFGDFDGIEMGVFSDGTPFLTTSGLAFICGVKRQTINEIGEDTPSPEDKLRAGKIAVTLQGYEFKDKKLYRSVIIDGKENNAYPEAVCLSVLEYYAFEAG
jgi:hypothetical protein